MKLRELSLFSGAGGGLLGSKLLGFQCIGYVEWDAYCQAVIKARQADGLLDVAPVFGDVREFVRSGVAVRS
jgi:DNA (cytosine-5)-methyltransferase 1